MTGAIWGDPEDGTGPRPLGGASQGVGALAGA
jgi:hypothetical protein